MPRTTPRRRILVAVLAILTAAVAWWNEQRGGVVVPPSGSASPASPASSEAVPGEAALIAAHDARREGVWVESEARIYRVLPDDREGSRHQRFLVRLSNGLSVKISHNIDLASRVDAREGDVLRFRGRYEWNDLGGVVHWTHHDPRGGPGGWLEFDGRRVE